MKKCIDLGTKGSLLNFFLHSQDLLFKIQATSKFSRENVGPSFQNFSHYALNSFGLFLVFVFCLLFEIDPFSVAQVS